MCSYLLPDKMSEGQEAVNVHVLSMVHEVRLRHHRERCVERHAREMPVGKRENLPVIFLVALLCWQLAT